MPADLDSASGKTVSAPPRPIFENALCAIDGGEGGFEAVRQAAAMAGPGGELTLLLVTSFRNEGDVRGPAIGPDQAHEIVTRGEEIAREAGVSAWVEVDPAAPPARVVLDWASRHDLLAIGAPSASWLTGLLAAGVADTAREALPTALLTARAPAAGLCDHVLIASDARQDSAMPLAFAADIALARRARVTLLHARGHGRRGAGGVLLEQAEYLRARGIAQPDLLLRHGRPHEVIVDAARRLDASLVVLGSRRLHGPRALGSVSRRVIHEAGCSVLTVPPERAAAEAGR